MSAIETTANSPPVSSPPDHGSKRARRINWDWLGVAPFFLFAVMFLIAPILYLVTGAFRTSRADLPLRILLP
jgi:putative spermidine/putrescine transport system permease protein